MHAEGVTLIELLVALSVMAIVLTLGVPAFTDFFASGRMSAAANDVVSAMHLARSEAIKRRRSVTVCASGNASSPNPACSAAANPGVGWLELPELPGRPVAGGRALCTSERRGRDRAHTPARARNAAGNAKRM